ncbi:MAG: N-acetylmuramoyl-L-alanine amidase [Alphaproteobacteria bacterium]|nr:N-acetylmuramoyl-L-alanine amidase [Alphaproteobacteria bacterium]MBP7759854.1 N-acetylmuramoyl-L-alanine amidase [Alphaproteobacteria bacterium]MBP7763174.1 N-acetylmuramoyl-L-alanine amidase [Alphaproteobacteria bacterium]MBP7904748.1 N-acetylmuramoyl-L-alanine amidase [Alphaproteobacteria bacterium]
MPDGSGFPRTPAAIKTSQGQRTPLPAESCNAILHDLLTKKTPFTPAEIEQIQTALTDLSIKTGKIDKVAGTKTAAGIADYLRSNMDLVPQLGDPAKVILRSYGQGETLQRLTLQAQIPNETRHYHEQQIETALVDLNAMGRGHQALKNNLRELGYLTEAQSKQTRVSNPVMMEAVMKYLEDHPQMLARTDSSLMRVMMQGGFDDRLQTLVQRSEFMDQRIEEKLKQTGNIETANYRDIYEIQTLLKIGGYNPGGIDGIVGGRLRGAVSRYNIANGSTQTPVPELRDQFRTETQVAAPVTPVRQPQQVTPPATPGTIMMPPAVGVTNGYGVSNAAIEQAWSRVASGERKPPEINPGSVSIDSTPKRPLVVIDLGHGSNIGGNSRVDPGAISPHIKNLSEVAVIDSLAPVLARQLHARGYQVAFTRGNGEILRLEGDHDRTLRVRSLFAHELAQEVGSQGVVMLSLHANSATNQSASGAYAYVQGSNGRASNAESQALARSIGEGYTIGQTPTRIHQADFSVLRNFESAVPKTDKVSAAVLIELGYLTNRGDAQALNEMRNNPSTAAAQIAGAVDNYVHQRVPGLPAPQTETAPAAPAPPAAATSAPEPDNGFSPWRWLMNRF